MKTILIFSLCGITAAGIIITIVLFFNRSVPVVAADYNCSDFKTRAQAQAYLLPGDPYHLDGNKNGIACEALQ